MKVELLFQKQGINGFTLCAISENRCFVREFIDNLEVSEQKKIVNTLEKIATFGPPQNIEKFKSLGEGIFEIKSHQVRILGFFEKERVIVLTHGFIKKSPKTPPSEIEKAKRLKNIYFGRKGG